MSNARVSQSRHRSRSAAEDDPQPPAVRRGRPPASSAPSAATRDRILDAAAQLLGGDGYSTFRLEDVASLAGVRAPAIYHYFGSRDQLIAAVLQKGQHRVREHVLRALADAPQDATAIDRVCIAVLAHIRVELDLSSYARAVMRNARQVPPAIRAELQQDSDAYHAIWRELLDDAAAAGQLRAGIDPSIARMLVIGALNWTAEWWTSTRSIDALASTATVMVRAALTAD